MLTLTATDLPRFFACNGSINMPQHVAFNVDDTVRNEGNAAHWLIEQVCKQTHTLDELVDRKAFNGVYITAEMIEHVTAFLAANKPTALIECDTSYGDGQRYQINGRADRIAYVEETQTLYVDDFKYGWSIVEPAENWTLLSHVFGWLFRNHDTAVQSVVLRIFQPRPHHPLGHVREKSYAIHEIRSMWERLYNILLNPLNELNTGKHCRNCPAMASCPASIKAQMNAVDVSETPYVSDIDNKNLGFILDQFDRSIKLLEQGKKAYTELALHRLKKGEIIPNYFPEKSQTNRQWKKGITPETMKILTGVEISDKPKLITPAQAIRKGISEETVNLFCERHDKTVTLTRMDADTAAKKFFKN